MGRHAEVSTHTHKGTFCVMEYIAISFRGYRYHHSLWRPQCWESGRERLEYWAISKRCGDAGEVLGR
ncbi:hypothetical protein CIPAW_05G150300 [Carya illinoinensis]|uniref:Uncharacterized protein n=1 Tax=Carya illinoinensis TaxID=32201 RepID=A0A8T1QK52_CARIL|nr:hypothetical protein CIPAW_05G150300 [Carya illinoinensis]